MKDDYRFASRFAVEFWRSQARQSNSKKLQRLALFDYRKIAKILDIATQAVMANPGRLRRRACQRGVQVLLIVGHDCERTHVTVDIHDLNPPRKRGRSARFSMLTL